MEHRSDEIHVWEYGNAPERFKQLAADTSSWIAFIPAHIATPDIEVLFMRWDSGSHPVIRCRLSDGGIVLAGSYPEASALKGDFRMGNVAEGADVQRRAAKSSGDMPPR
jgi:hypothetical protein